MPADSAQEFRSHRITLGAIALGVTAFATLWLASSVASALFVQPGASSSSGAADPASLAAGSPASAAKGSPSSSAAPSVAAGSPSELEDPRTPVGLARCEGEVEGLLDELQSLVAAVVADTPVAPSQPSPEQRLATAWPTRWRDVGAHWRFAALRDRGLGPAFDRLAWVHAELERLHRDYETALESYLARPKPRVDELRRALEATRRTLPPQGHGE